MLSAIFSFFKIKFAILDFVILGAIQLTLIFGANSAARETVRPSIAPFAEATMLWLVNPLLTATVENKTIEPLFCFKLSDAFRIISVAEIKFKDGDDLLFIHETMSDEKLLIFSSNGKFYTIDASQLPSGRGYGDPLKLLIDLQDNDKIISLYSVSQAGELVIASKFGYGFIVSFEDLISNRKAGKQILNLSSDDEAISSDYLKGTNIAVIGENKKMLLFNQEELPRMSKGKGVRLQKYKEGNLKSIISFNYSEGLNIVDNNGRNRNFDDIENWLGKRGQAGKKVPKGFPRNF